MSVRKFNISRLTKAFTIGAEFTVVNTLNQAILAQPGVSPLVKTIVGAETMFTTYEIARSAMDNLPPIMKKIAKPLLAVQEVLLGIQQIPNLIAAITQFTGQTQTAGAGVAPPSMGAPAFLDV